MPPFDPTTRRYLDQTLLRLEQMIYTPVAPLEITGWCTKEPVAFADRRSGDEHQFAVGDVWGKLFDCAWFRFSGSVPRSAKGTHVVLLLDVNGEMCVYDSAGIPLRGLTTTKSQFDSRLGRPGKRVFEFLSSAAGGEAVDVWADAGSNDLFGNLTGGGSVAQAEIAVCADDARALFYDFSVLLDLAQVLPADSSECSKIGDALLEARSVIEGTGTDRVARARAVLAPRFARQSGEKLLTVSAVGHAHMDLAWLWPIRETVRKGTRTFATAVELMGRYPDYIFGASQPQLFQWILEREPALYAKVVERVRDGRFEPQGALWVEADANLTSGESLVRQLLYGKRFFREQFGLDVNYAWLPDVFGYTGALPQILKLAGVDYFLTQKLSWSLFNTFPYHSFHWAGIDGTPILAHMFPENTYNSPAQPHSAHAIEKNYREKSVSSHALMPFGIGDGGGGPGAEHLERLKRIGDLPGLPHVRQERVADFLPAWSRESDRFPTWVGELYLERHQGTLTTQGAMKRFNRRLELALREWEWLSALCEHAAGIPYPRDILSRIWRKTLLYQFHDILPGSSIKRVYDECLPDYEAMIEEVERGIDSSMKSLAGEIGTSEMQDAIVAFNSLSWERTEWIHVQDQWIRVALPPMGYAVVDISEPITSADQTGKALTELVATGTSLENDLLRLEFSPDGSIASIRDKVCGREVLADGAAANRLAVYVDHGDAWDFPMDYAKTEPRFMQLVSTEARVDGPRATVVQRYRLGHSELEQNISLLVGSRRIDFATHVRWRETASMLRTSFPVSVHATEASYDIQFGYITRPTHSNTSWDRAREEVCAQKWADLSQRDYGVALLNDSKYGHKVKGNTLDLNLIRSVPYPGPAAVSIEPVLPGEPDPSFTDQGGHKFTYALYPHIGDHVEGGVMRAGYELNVPVRVSTIATHTGADPAKWSWLRVDAPNIIVEAVKGAEDSDHVVVRLYESENRTTQARLQFGPAVQSIEEVNLMEEQPRPSPLSDNGTTVEFRPFEIKTLKVSLQHRRTTHFSREEA